jgi:tRNA 2-thiouridine synthesizing protein A
MNDEAIFLDLKGLKCPLPVLRARKFMRNLNIGTLLRIECTDPLSAIDIPHMCTSDNIELIEQGTNEDVLWFLLKK